MQSNQDLWMLVHSLSKSEKRYFKRYAQLWGDEVDLTYLRLFDIMLDLPAYDPHAIGDAMQAPSFEKRYSAHKNYLHQLICRAMRAYYAEKSAVNQLHGLLSDAAFLYQKTLFTQSQKCLRKAWKIASSLEMFTYMLEILRWERRLLKRIRGKSRGSQLAELSEKAQSTLQSFNEEWHLHLLYETVYGLNQAAHDLCESVDAVFEAHTQWTQSPPAGSFQAKHFYFQIHIYREQLHGDLGQALKFQEQQVALWDEHAVFQSEEPFRYASVLANYLSLLTVNHVQEPFDSVRARIAQLRMETPLEEFQINQQLHYLDLLYCLNHPAYPLAHAVIDRVEHWLAGNAKQLNTSRWMAFGYNLAILQFLRGHFSDALKWVRELLADGHQPERKDAQAFLQLLLFLLYFEMHEPDLLESQQRALARYLKLYYDHSYPPFMLAKLGKAFLAPPGPPQTRAFADILASIEAHPERSQWDSDLGFKEIMLWLRRKAAFGD